ncbi:hypothetical protein ACA910_013076 [Epithemia clementina (nom. ined.)]
MLHYIPLAQTALERQGSQLTEFLQFVLSKEQKLAHFLTPEDWFYLPQDSNGLFIWCPPPCLGDVAVYQMAESFHMRPWNTHVLVIPLIMARRWQKMMYKAADFLCTLPFSDDQWPMATEYEPLTLAFAFSLLNRIPWRTRRSDICVKREDTVRLLHRKCLPFVRDYLREFWLQARALEALPSVHARAVLLGLCGPRPIPTGPYTDRVGNLE